jgi:hypothetical protein
MRWTTYSYHKRQASETMESSILLSWYVTHMHH